MISSPLPPFQRRQQQPQGLSFLGEAALAYAAKGFRVFPLAPGEKVPLGRLAPHGCLDATCDPRRITTWWGAEPCANVGIATGRESGLVVIDIDPGHGGEESFRQLEEQFEKLPPTLTARTGSGGQHLYYRYPLLPSSGSTIVLGNTQGIHDYFPGIDSRGEGGYVVAPPSAHPSGTCYAWDEKRAPAQLPPWLIVLLAKKEPPVVSSPPPIRGYPLTLYVYSSGTPQSRQKLVDSIVEETLRRASVGSRNAHGMTLAVILRDRSAEITQSEAESAMRQYARRVPQGDHPYMEEEAMTTFRRIYFSRPRSR